MRLGYFGTATQMTEKDSIKELNMFIIIMNAP